MGTVTNFPNAGPRSMTLNEMLTSFAERHINQMPEEKRAAAWASFRAQVLEPPELLAEQRRESATGPLD